MPDPRPSPHPATALILWGLWFLAFMAVAFMAVGFLVAQHI